MSLNFSEVETRILGCLIEKQLATPDYYPMTPNAVQLAANQKSSRDPVMTLSIDEIDEAMQSLSRKEFVEQIRVSGARSFKFRQRLDQRWGISELTVETQRDQLAVLAVLALRGAQTLGQIRQRCERMFHFPDLSAVSAIIAILSDETESRPALVREDHTLPGREIRYTHLLFDHPSTSANLDSKNEIQSGGEFSPDELQAILARLTALEEHVTELREIVQNTID